MSHRQSALAACVCWGLACGPASAGESWVEVRTPAFTVYADDGEKAARRVSGRLEDMRAFLQEEWRWARFAPSPPVVVVGLRDAPRFNLLLPSRFGRPGAVHVAGITVHEPCRTLILLRGDVREDPAEENPYHVAYHELVHAVLDRSPLPLPLWLNEGLAEFWGSTKITEREVQFGRPIGTHVVTLRRQPSLPLETLFRVDASSPQYSEHDKATIFYAESWLLVHYLALGAPSRTGQLNQLAELLAKGRDPLEAAREVLGDLNALRRELEEYAKRSAFRFKRHQRRWAGDGSPGEPRRLPPAEVLALRGGVLASVGRAPEGRPLLEEALTLDPGLVPAMESLGNAAFFADDRALAQRWLGRSAASGRASFFTHFALGVLASRESTPDGLARAEAELRESVRLDDAYARSDVALASVLARRGGAGEEIERLLRRAIELAANDAGVRLAVAADLVLLNRPDEARREAEIAARLATDARLARQARALLRSFEEPRERATEARSAASPPAVGPDPGETPDAISAQAWEERCDDGESAACLALAEKLEHGIGLPVDKKRAASLREKACAAGLRPACAPQR